MDEILKAIEASNKAFGEFRESQNRRIVTIEKALAGFEAKAFNRLGNSGGNDGVSNSNAPEAKAFDRYLRTGDAAELKSLDTGNAAEGGYAVPKVIDNQIESLMLLQSPIRANANVVATSSGDFHKLVNLRGLAASWAAEATARPETAAMTFADVVPPSGDLYANPMASQWMIDDASFNLGAYLTENVVDAFSEAESSAFLTGNGTTKPKGILTYTAVSTADASRAFGQLQYVPTGAAGAFKTVSATESPFDILTNTVASMKVAYRRDAKWYLSPATLASLINVKDTVGRPIIIPPLTEGAPTTILGYEVVECEHMPAIAANSLSIMFANLKRGYIVTDRIGTRVLVDPYTNKPFVGWYCTRRTGGAVVNSEAIKLVKFAAS